MLQRLLGSECQERGRKIAGSACHSVFQAREQNGLRAYGSFSKLGTKSCILKMVAAVFFRSPMSRSRSSESLNSASLVPETLLAVAQPADRNPTEQNLNPGP